MAYTQEQILGFTGGSTAGADLYKASQQHGFTAADIDGAFSLSPGTSQSWVDQNVQQPTVSLDTPPTSSYLPSTATTPAATTTPATTTQTAAPATQTTAVQSAVTADPMIAMRQLIDGGAIGQSGQVQLSDAMALYDLATKGGMDAAQISMATGIPEANITTWLQKNALGLNGLSGPNQQMPSAIPSVYGNQPSTSTAGSSTAAGTTSTGQTAALMSPDAINARDLATFLQLSPMEQANAKAGSPGTLPLFSAGATNEQLLRSVERAEGERLRALAFNAQQEAAGNDYRVAVTSPLLPHQYNSSIYQAWKAAGEPAEWNSRAFWESPGAMQQVQSAAASSGGSSASSASYSSSGGQPSANQAWTSAQATAAQGQQGFQSSGQSSSGQYSTQSSASNQGILGLDAAPNVQTATHQVQPNETAVWQLAQMLASDSTYIRQAEKDALQQAAGRNLINSSMAAGAGRAAAIRAAEPFAINDANTYSRQALENMRAQNQSNITAAQLAQSERESVRSSQTSRANVTDQLSQSERESVRSNDTSRLNTAAQLAQSDRESIRSNDTSRLNTAAQIAQSDRESLLSNETSRLNQQSASETSRLNTLTNAEADRLRTVAQLSQSELESQRAAETARMNQLLQNETQINLQLLSDSSKERAEALRVSAGIQDSDRVSRTNAFNTMLVSMGNIEGNPELSVEQKNEAINRTLAYYEEFLSYQDTLLAA